MRLPIAYSIIKERNLVLTNNATVATYQREALSERPLRYYCVLKILNVPMVLEITKVKQTATDNRPGDIIVLQ